MRIGSPFAMIGMDFVNVPRTKLIPIMRLRPFVAQSPSADSARSGLFGANVTFVRSRRTNVTFAPFGKRFPSSILTLSRSIAGKTGQQRQDRHEVAADLTPTEPHRPVIMRISSFCAACSSGFLHDH